MDIAAQFEKAMAKSVKKHHVSTSEPSLPATLVFNGITFNIDGSIQYKEKPYFSASEALDAYIDDFYLSCKLPDINDTKVNLDQSPLEFLAKLNSGKLSLFSEFNFQLSIESWCFEKICDLKDYVLENNYLSICESFYKIVI